MSLDFGANTFELLHTPSFVTHIACGSSDLCGCCSMTTPPSPSPSVSAFQITGSHFSQSLPELEVSKHQFSNFQILWLFPVFEVSISTPHYLSKNFPNEGDSPKGIPGSST